MNNNFLTDYLASTLRLSVPLAYAAMGGLFSERSGVLNIGLEGMLLTGAFTSAAATFYSGNVAVGICAALIAGGFVGLVHAFLCVTLRVNQLVSGLAINLVAGGLTSFLGRLIFSGSTQRLPVVPAIKIPILTNIPVIGILFEQDILVYLLFLIIAVTTYFLFYTNPGLNLRAVGEYPSSADTAGISVALVRYVAVVTGGCLVGCGGAYLALVQINYFTEGMSAGKGFIAIASLIFGRWHPIGSALACLLFGATEALQLRIQAFGVNIPYQFLTMLPYAVAMIALIGGMGKSTPPAALGVPYERNSAGKNI
ncbi:ABC transporter permease [Dulcicalothrix desertica PCC 7102]|uniref:ABC transporter permease n=1 Tax=Dulcicalothrix desertica PCC 7102 TaxID=232991 RepID=A0A3S1CS44_9CYAN|nr:ABC transporter permease [Dulcicalothrix desertica]RUT07550.1 ABC transporter permease [Dulcicalothrix desertica PCC 7102]TWH39722.1 nucleoside ABC transporter membrane protein [Dulcicalothrix desertica PCC 7102]